jgi:hypothetical protein
MYPLYPTYPPLANDPAREAVDPMRAYNYQVLRSVLAWIKLADNEIIYVEGAEDFDRIDASNATTVQVRDTKGSGNITLRTKGVVEAIGHYWGHQQRNPQRRIAFHYLTTSNAGMEKGDPLGQGVPGIDLWEKIKTESDPARRAALVEKLRVFLSNLEGLPQELKDFLAERCLNEVLDKLIMPITWHTSAESSEMVLKEIRDFLVLHGNREGIGAGDAEKVLAALHYEAWRVATKNKDRALSFADFIRIFDEHTRISIPIKSCNDRARADAYPSGPLSVDFTPPLPAALIRRAAIVSELKRSLVDTASQRGNAPPCVALVGMPGVGKSVLAALLAHDPEVRARYPAGVLWATLGKQPDIISLLLGWIPALGGRPLSVSSAEAASAMVRRALATGRYLIVVDDAWTPESIEPFRVGGPDCAMVLTTRDSSVARRFSGQPQQVNVLAPDEALDLLRQSAVMEFDDAQRSSAERLTQVLEYLPLAIEIAGAQIADGISINNLKDAIEREVARLDLLDLIPADAIGVDDAARKRLSVEVSFSLSLRGIGDEIADAFAWLGVIPEDAAFGANAMRTIWGMEEVTDAEHRLAQLRRRGLLQDVANKGQAMRRYRLHDLLHDFARRLLTGDPEVTRMRLGIKAHGLALAVANEEVVRRYGALLPNGCWSDLSDDGYVHQHLTYHMEQAGRLDALDDLLHRSDREGGNAWFLARERLGQVAGFVSDLERFRRYAIADARNDPRSLGRAISAAVIQSSLVSRANTIPDALSVACVRHGFWTPAQGLEYARLMPTGIGRVWTLTALAPFLGERWKNEVADEVFAEATAELSRGGLVASLGVEKRALDLLIPLLPEALKQRLLTLSSVAPVNSQARMAVQMAPYLDDATRHRFIAAIAARCKSDAPGREGDKLEALAQLGKLDGEHLGANWDINLLTRACDAGDIGSVYKVFKLVAQLAQDKCQKWMLNCLAFLESDNLLAEVLLSFSDNLTDGNRRFAIGIASNHQEPIVKYWLIGHLACGLQDHEQSILRSCIEFLRVHPRDHRKFAAFHDFLRWAPSILRAEIEDAAIDAGAEFGFGELGAGPLQEFTPKLSPRGLERMADIVIAQGTDFDRTQGLPALLACVDEGLVPDLCHALISTLRTSPNHADFAPFGDRIPKDLLPEFLASCRIGDEGVVSETIAAAVPFVPSLMDQRELHEALDNLHGQARGVERVRVAVASLTKGLAEDIEEVMEDTAKSIRSLVGCTDGHSYLHEKNAEALQVLLANMSMTDRVEFAESLLGNEIMKLSEYNRHYYLAALAVVSPIDIVDRIVMEVRKVGDGKIRARLLSLLGICCGERRTDLFRLALAEARKIPEDHFRFDWLRHWISHIPHELASDGLSLADSCKSRIKTVAWRLVTFPLLRRRDRRVCEADIRRMTGEDLSVLHGCAIQRHLLEVLSTRQWRDLAATHERKPDFARFVLCLDYLNNQDLYLKALTSLPLKRPDNIELCPWFSFGIAAASLPASRIHPWLVVRIGDLATAERSILLPALEFLWPILNNVGGTTLVERVVRSIILAQRWWP